MGETAAFKPAFRVAFRKRRCLVLADGFYEWRKDGKAKIPTYIFLKSGEPFAFARLWETWKSPDGDTQPDVGNSFREAEALWPDPLIEEPGLLTPLLIPAPGELMDSYPVSTLVNSPKNQGPECIAPVGPTAP